MEAEVEKLFDKSVKHQAATIAGTQAEHLQPLGSFENYVFEYEHANGPRILRMTHSSHRSLAQVLSELDFVQYLHAHGAAVAAPIANDKGTLATAIEASDGSYFIVSTFGKATGVGKEAFELEPAIIENWGKITGQMHRLTKSYIPTKGIEPRYTWYNDPALLKAANDERLTLVARERFHSIMAEIKSIAASISNFGLIHTDLHHGNFFVNNNEIVAFDFDDSCYQYFVHDIAIPLYYALWKGYPGMDNEAFVKYYLKHFVKGYEHENALPKGWLQQLPLFLNLRSFVLYAVLTQKLDLANATPKQWDTLEYCRKLACGETELFNFEISYDA